LRSRIIKGKDSNLFFFQQGIIAVSLDGWSASLKHKSQRMSELVQVELEQNENENGVKFRHLALKSRLTNTNTRKVMRFIRDEQNDKSQKTLILFGKSLGGWNIWHRIVPNLDGVKYSRITVVTVDPCRPFVRTPLTSSLAEYIAPNLNDHEIIVRGFTYDAVNFYARIKGPGPAGALVRGKNVQNFPLHGVNHHSIIHHPGVSACIRFAVRNEWPF
jgi:hypothetical protein